jgi:hypothetical protein
LYNTNFHAPDAHFDYLSLFSGTEAKKFGNPKKKCENSIRAQKKQILCREIKANQTREKHLPCPSTIYSTCNIVIDKYTDP